MKASIINIGLTALAFFLFAFMLLLGVFKRRRLYYLCSIIFFAFFLGGTFYSIYCIASTTSTRIHASLEPRTGPTIYTAIFGKGEDDCVQVLESKDQIIPRLDVGIFLHFRACPAEIARITTEADLKKRESATELKAMELTLAPSWFQPNLLGESVAVWEYVSTKGNNWRTMFVKSDMSEAFYADIAD